MKKLFKRLLWGIIQFLEVQFFLSLVSLPILIAWGIPFSVATVVGNFIFSPFLTLFLLCASLIFFTQLCCVPNGWLLWALEVITQWWLWTLSWGEKSWLICFPEAFFWVSVIIALICFMVIQHKILGKQGMQLICLGVCALFFMCAYRVLSTRIQTIEVACGNKRVCAVAVNQALIVQDRGAFSTKKSGASWVQYTLLPELIKKLGSHTIEKVVVEESNGNSFAALKELCLHARVKKIVLPYFLRTLEKHEWRSYYALMEAVKKEHIMVIRK